MERANLTPDREAAWRVERIIRQAARAGNRMIAGNPVVIDTASEAVPAALQPRLRETLARMGARVVGRKDPRAARALFLGDGGAAVRGTGPGARIDWAAAHMPATRAVAAELAARGSLAGERVLLSLVLEPKTAVLALTLARVGVETAVFGAVSETDPRVAAELAVRGVAVFAPGAPGANVDPRAAAQGERGEPMAAHPEAWAPRSAAEDVTALDATHAAAALAWGPTLLVDDGAHLIRLAHTEHPGVLAEFGGPLRAASEETTSGVRPLTEMAAEGALRLPVIAANDARTKTGFDNLVGTGQSCVFAIGDVLEAAGEDAASPGHAWRGFAGRRITVIGYGPVGQGVARFAAALGAEITVVERDAVCALAAVHDGHEALPLADALPGSELVISATGVWHTVDLAAFERLAGDAPGAVLAVAGGIDDELALDSLRANGWTCRESASNVAEWRAPNLSAALPGLFVLAGGGGVNYTAAEGNPIEVMDLSFATQLVALDRLAGGGLVVGVHRLGEDDENRVARAALGAQGAGADPRPASSRAGGAAQPWPEHRYRA